MDLHHFPFFGIAGALVVHGLSFWIAVSTGTGWMREWSKGGQTARLFTVQRREVSSTVSSLMIVLSRTALVVAIVSPCLGMSFKN